MKTYEGAPLILTDTRTVPAAGTVSFATYMPTGTRIRSILWEGENEHCFITSIQVGGRAIYQTIGDDLEPTIQMGPDTLPQTRKGLAVPLDVQGAAQLEVTARNVDTADRRLTIILEAYRA
jgi:hypothetical protein